MGTLLDPWSDNDPAVLERYADVPLRPALELEPRADAGRLGAVISHIRAVAEQIETVLRVNYRPEGSEVLRVTGAEREAFVEEEVEQGLLA